MSLHAQCVVGAGTRTIDAEIDVKAGSPLVLVGPNGAGKTTLLRALSGLAPLARGIITLDGVTLDDPTTNEWVPSDRRRVGYVPQERFLFPHLSVLDNIAFASRNRSMARDWLDRASLTTFANRRPSSLSGGEAARVAMVRALAADPRMLLLDEPLAALDASAKSEMRAFLRSTLETFSGVAVIVTHDPIEALTTASEIAVLEEGRISQRGSAPEILERPRTEYVARFLGLNLVRGRALRDTVQCEGAHVIIAEPAPARDVLLSFPAAAVALSVSRPEGATRNVFECTVREIVHEGSRLRITLAGSLPLTAEVTRAGGEALHLQPGSRVYASIKATEINVEPA
ncbi:MAG: ABC transporter ATP-binding protein [Actinomycetota bacterium]